MNSEFQSVIKARDRDGIFTIVASASLLLVSTIGGISLSLSPATEGLAVYALLVALALTGCVYLIRAVSNFRAAREWEFCANADRLWWLMRDKSEATLDGEVYIRDIRALIYHADDDVDPFLEIEFNDSSIVQLPSRGHLTRPQLLKFINYWRDAHSDIPIKNLF